MTPHKIGGRTREKWRRYIVGDADFAMADAQEVRDCDALLDAAFSAEERLDGAAAGRIEWLTKAGTLAEARALAAEERVREAEQAQKTLARQLDLRSQDRDAETQGLLAQVDALRERVQRSEEALREITHTPPMPFPDPGAHSWRAFAERVYSAWSRIQSIARTVLAEPSARAAHTTAGEEGR